VAIEDLKVANMVRRSAPKPAEDGSGAFLPNQAKAKGCLNRSMYDAGLGQLRVMLEAKGKERGRLVVAVDPKHTSQRCSACGHTAPENRQSQELFCCQACGHSDNADVNAAKNTLRLGCLPLGTLQRPEPIAWLSTNSPQSQNLLNYSASGSDRWRI
jgi:putative transposase